MNEIEIKRQSFSIQETADNLIVRDNESLQNAIEIIKAIRKQKEIIAYYWKNAKESTKKAYQEISNKEKEMIDICEKNERILKNRILDYMKCQKEKQKSLINQAKKERESQIENLLKEAIIFESKGDLEQFEYKLDQAEKLENIDLSLDSNLKETKITTQKRWKCRITDNKSVPAFFNGVEIREINTKKLLEIRKLNPNVKIPGVEFYQSENIVIKN